MFFAERDSTASADRLWEVLADVTSWPDLLDHYTSVRPVGDPTPTGVGSRFEIQQPALKTATYEVTVWQPGRRFTWVAHNPGVTVTATHSVAALDNRSRLSLGIEMGGPLAWLVRPLLAAKTRRYVEAEADGLVAYAQSDG